MSEISFKNNDILEGAKEVFGFNNDDKKYTTTSIYDLISEGFKFPESETGLRCVLNRWGDKCINPEYAMLRKR